MLRNSTLLFYKNIHLSKNRKTLVCSNYCFHVFGTVNTHFSVWVEIKCCKNFNLLISSQFQCRVSKFYTPGLRLIPGFILKS